MGVARAAPTAGGGNGTKIDFKLDTICGYNDAARTAIWKADL